METPSFKLGETITPAQRAFFEEQGFIRFSGVASDAECDRLIAAMDEMERAFVAEGRDTMMGVPVQWGKNADGSPFVNRFAYASHYSPVIQEFVLDSRFEPVRHLIGDRARLAELEKDGVVINNFLNTEGSAATVIRPDKSVLMTASFFLFWAMAPPGADRFFPPVRACPSHALPPCFGA